MTERSSRSGASGAPGTAQLLVVLLSFCWGFVWIATAFALHDVKPWALRMAGVGIGAATLFTAARIAGYDLTVPKGERFHVMVGGFFNIAAFHVLTAFAQMNGGTSRTVVITYSMPIWATLLSVVILRERLDRARLVAFVLCVAGISVLVWPLFGNGLPVFVFYALAAAIGWAFAIVYMKWVRATVPPLANAAWQLLFSFGFLVAGTLIFEGMPHLWPIGTASIVGIAYIGVFGVGLAHFLFWSIIGRLSTATAAIGVLLVPVVGITAATIILGERPTPTDIVGFALIFLAAATVLLKPAIKTPVAPE